MKKHAAEIIIILSLTLIMTSCSNADTAFKGDANLDSETLADTTDDSSIEISSPSDPNASYKIVKIDEMSNGNLEVISKRQGPSGISFARREISCSNYTYRYLGEGNTQAESEEDSSYIGEMSALTGTSASSDVANAACEKIK